MISWEQLPPQMQNETVRAYYDVLKKRRGALVLKRCFDLVMSSLMILLLSPILLVLAVLIKKDSPGPVFYRQERVTTGGKVFRIFKFRTMVVNADRIGSLVTTAGDSRITKMGRKIRNSSLDEIPQLFNIFKGEMSFVGTRPEVPKYVAAYDDEMWATLLMPAGVTSIASITYKKEDERIAELTKDGMSVDDAYIRHILPEKMQYNYEYLKSFGFFKDIAICVKTLM
ncbi:MAG: sugar transferase [Firmicutes bacterium]|nr:sugar transferase [Bacillota bacterium]